jgi:hypothetical protein
MKMSQNNGWTPERLAGMARLKEQQDGRLESQRTWVGLTDEEKKSFWKADQMTQEEWDELFNAIEAKLKEKNT